MPPDYDDTVIAYIFVTLVYLVLAWLSVFIARRGFKLVTLGILTAVASLGYAALVMGGAVILAPTLMKLAFVLVLGGVAQQLFARTAAGVSLEPLPPEDRTDV